MFYSVFILMISTFMLSVVAPDTTLTLRSPAFKGGQPIPVQYTCDGKNISPAIHWANVPESTKSFALIIDDPDAGTTPWVHWVIFNIPENQRSLQKDIPDRKEWNNGALQGTNSFKEIGYGGPCPPAGPPHHYVMKLYALNAKLDLPPGSTKAQVIQALKKHVIEKAVLKAPYKRR